MASVAPAPHRFTVDEYYRMAEAGLLGEDDRVELIQGEIIDMAPIGHRHPACVKRINEVLGSKLRGIATLGVQDPVRLSDLSEPQPDVAVLRPRDDFYATAHPTPSDVLLLIEVADTSAAWDRDVKARLYSRVGVPELWVIDLEHDVIDVFTQPASDGYEKAQRRLRGERLMVADVELAVDDILG